MKKTDKLKIKLQALEKVNLNSCSSDKKEGEGSKEGWHSEDSSKFPCLIENLLHDYSGFSAFLGSQLFLWSNQYRYPQPFTALRVIPLH